MFDDIAFLGSILAAVAVTIALVGYCDRLRRG